MAVKCPPNEKRYCRLCKKKETRGQCAYGPRMWGRYSVKDASETEQKQAAEESGITNGNGNGGNGNGNGGNGGGLGEEWKLEEMMTKSQIKKRDEIADSMSTREFNKRYGKDRGKNVKYATATKLAMKEKVSTVEKPYKSNVETTIKSNGIQKIMGKQKEKNLGHGSINEKSKSGDSSLHDWFSKSRSSDGKPGWVQLGGKYAGKPCAKQPGQTTKPKCGSSKMKRNLNKKEEDAAFRRKNRQDPNPDRKGKAINVKTESTEIQTEGKKDACYHKVKSRYSVWPSAYASGALVKCRKVGAANWGNKSKKEEFEGKKSFQEFQAEGKKCWKGYEKKGTQTLFGKTYNRCVKKEEHELEEGAAWTRKAGKNKSGGLNEKGRKSYERENPGSDLKAPSKKVGNPRRASFCARMKGMKKKLTSKKTASDPDSRINKSLRAWNC